MITTILEVLVAVVVLIVIIAVAALRFLRADDSDTFEDVPDEPRRKNRPPVDAPRDLASAAAERGRPRRPEPAREPQWAAERGARTGDGRGQLGYRERDSQSRPARTHLSRCCTDHPMTTGQCQLACRFWAYGGFGFDYPGSLIGSAISAYNL